MTATRSAGTGPVLARALQILGAFSAERPAMTLTELARQTGLPVCYRIGLRLWEVGALAPRGQGLRERALPFLEDLSQITRENVQLAVREGTELVFVERIAGTGAVPVLTRVGGRFALTATGVGLVLLAHAPVDVQEEVLSRPIARYTPRTVTDPGELRRMLADVRSSGFAVSDRQVTMDALSVAAPGHRCRVAGGAARQREPARPRPAAAHECARFPGRSPGRCDPAVSRRRAPAPRARPASARQPPASRTTRTARTPS